MASRFLHLRRLLPSTNRSTLIGRPASVSVSGSGSGSGSPLPRRPVSALYHTSGTVETINFGAGKSFPYVYKGLAYDDKHWIIGMRPPTSWSRIQMIDSYLKTLAKVVGSLEEARMKMYSVCTELHVFNFRAYITEEQAAKLHVMKGVKYVIPDVFVDDQLFAPDDLLDHFRHPQPKPRTPHFLDSIRCNARPDDFTKPMDEAERARMRKEMAALLKSRGLDDGAIEYLLTTAQHSAKKLGDCTAQPI